MKNFISLAGACLRAMLLIWSEKASPASGLLQDRVVAYAHR